MFWFKKEKVKEEVFNQPHCTICGKSIIYTAYVEGALCVESKCRGVYPYKLKDGIERIITVLVCHICFNSEKDWLRLNVERVSKGVYNK